MFYVLLFFSLVGGALPTFPNIGYVGTGYNLLYGNPAPQAGTTDQGWVAPVLQLTYNQNNTSRDRRWLLPDQVQAEAAVSCAFSAETSTMKRILDYQSSLAQSISAHVGISVNLWFAAFSASEQYQSVQSQFGSSNSSSTNIFISAGSTCQTYRAELLSFLPMNVTKSFRAAVSQMPTSFSSANEQWFAAFFQYFGTSYTTSINMGASASFQFELTSTAYSNLNSNNVDVSAGASLSFFATFGFDASSSSNYQDYVAFKNAVSMTTTVGIGAAPPFSTNLSDWAAWQQKVSAINQDSEPFPIQYGLASLATLLTKDIFPDDPQIAQKQAALGEALENYCGQIVQNCGAPPPPPPPANKTIGWKMFGFDASHSHRSPYVGPSTNHLQWRHATGGQVLSSPAIGADGTIYVGSDDFNLYAFDAAGNVKWKFATGGVSSPAIGADGTIYIGSNDHNLYAIHAAGNIKWKFATGGSVFSPPAIGTDGTIYIGSNDHNLYAIHAAGTLKWKFATGGSVDSSPAIGADGTIYVGSDDNNTYAIDAAGNIKWKFATGYMIWSSPAIGADGTIYVGGSDWYLYAIDAAGNMKWKFFTLGWGDESPAIGADGTIYIGSSDSNLYAIDAAGTLKWKFATGGSVSSSPAIDADGTIYVGSSGSSDNSTYAIDAAGTLKWKFAAGGAVESSPAIGADGSIYFGSDDGYLYAIKDI